MDGGIPIRLLLLEDSESDEALVLTQLRRDGFRPEVLRVESREAFRDAIEGGPWDLIIVDYNLPSFNGLEALEIYKQSGIDIPFILLSGTVGEEVAVEAMRSGGHDYMLKDRLVRLAPAIRREIREAEGRAARRRTEQALLESNALLSRTFQASPDAMVVMNLSDGSIVEANERFERVFGRPDGASLGGWEDAADGPRMLGLLRERGALQDWEVRRRTLDGSTVVNLVSAASISLGERTCAVVVFRDITGWRLAQASAESLEKQLRQSQKLEAIGRLAGGIAHDFNNILAAIMGNAQLADMDLDEGHPAKENIRQTLAASVRARDLINQILVFSRRGSDDLETIQLSRFVTDSLRLLRATVPSTIRFVTSLPEDVPPILANTTQLLQVLLNLTSNAVHSMEPGGGQLELRVEQVTVGEGAPHPGAVAPGSYAILKVIDSGCGMEESVLEQIFEPFFTTKEAGKGTGLGLSTVHGIIKQHEGYVFVRSKPGQGTAFDLYFPVSRGPSLSAAASRTPFASGAVPGGGQRILVLDDERDVSDIIDRVLRRGGYTVDTFAEPLAALSAFRASPDRYAMVITDLTMPQMRGVGVAEAIWQLRPKMPILLVTGFSSAVELESYRAMGLRGPLPKPFLAEALTAAVADCLSPSA